MTLKTPLCISIFPEKESGSHFQILDDSQDNLLHKSPLDWSGDQHNGLMTINELVQGGHELRDARILVVVKSIGVRKKGE